MNLDRFVFSFLASDENGNDFNKHETGRLVCYMLYVVLKERLWKYVRLRMSMMMVDTTVRHKNNI